ncbi:unnamed protein product [Adineta steineri]|uniref:Uncharacterized protein n=1 Tax=Adineta steineri TaxID=433720 RepID=A0A815WQ54_9BILA|nr:unnamed protein product [Adineta steineri]CAF1658898.1 unnamed protein product [Adineta steineri]
MFSETAPSHLSEAIMTVRKMEKNFVKTQMLTMEHDRNKIRSNVNRHMETFLHMTQKRHETWYRYDKYFREALKKEKDRHEKRKERTGSATHPSTNSYPSLITLNSLSEPITKTEQRTYQVLQASKKLLSASASRSQSARSQSRPSTSQSTFKTFSTTSTTTKSSCTFNSASLIVPMTQSIDYKEYNRLMNESLKDENYGNFIDHFIKFRPEFRENFAQFHQANQRRNAVEKLREFNQTYAKQKDQRYYDLINSLTTFRLEQKRKQYKI